VAKRFVTGTEIDAEVGQVATRTGDFRDDYIGGSRSDFAASVRQPLLRGAGRKANLAGIRIAELLDVQASATVTAEVLETLRAVETAYFSATVAAMVEKSQMASYSRALKLVDDVQIRRKAGAATKIDEMEATAALSLARERLVHAQKISRDRVGDLWLAAGAPLGAELPDVNLAALTDNLLPDETPDAGAAFSRAMNTAPSAVLLINEVQRKELELLRAKNRALPRLDAEVSVASASADSGKDDWEGVALMRFNVPWGMRAEKAQLAAARAELERSEAAREEATQRLKQRIFELCRAIQAGRAQMQAASQTARVSRQKYDEQLTQLKAGLATIRDLRESEEELQSSEVREQQARLGLFAGWSALTQLDGSSVQRYGLSL
jgi:outer membrane protein TolC